MLSDGTADVRCSREKSAITVQHDMPLQGQLKREMNDNNKMQLWREWQGGRIRKAVTGGDKAYLEGDEGGYAGGFSKRRVSRSGRHI